MLGAFARLPPAARLELVGVEERELRALGAGLPASVTERIRAHGFVGEARRARLLAAADVLCAPSLQGESFGLVLVEGMAAGLPVVASEVPGYVDLLPSDCGRFVPPGDASALAATVEALLADPELRQRLGSAGRRAARRFDWSVVGAQILDVYHELLGAPAPAAVPAS